MIIKKIYQNGIIDVKPFSIFNVQPRTNPWNDSADIGTSREAWAVFLANSLSSQQLVTKAFASRGSPQYLMPVRYSVFQALGSHFPRYADMYQLVLNANPYALRIGPTSRNWFNANKSGIRQEILSLSDCPPPAPSPQAIGKGK